MPAQPQLGLEAIFHRAQAQLAQPVGLGRRDVAVSELLERLAPPQPQRLAQHRTCGPGRAVRKRTGRLGGQLLKARRVQGPGLNPQQIPGRAGDQHLAGGAAGPVRLQHTPQPLDVRLQGLGGGRWRLLTPQPPGRARLPTRPGWVVSTAGPAAGVPSAPPTPPGRRQPPPPTARAPQTACRERSPPGNRRKEPNGLSDRRCHRAATRPPPSGHRAGRRCFAPATAASGAAPSRKGGRHAARPTGIRR
jgi:hypothetical protein